MGFPSCLEDNDERNYEGRMMIAAFEERIAPKVIQLEAPRPNVVALRPIAPPARSNAEAIDLRTRALREQHLLALSELRPSRAVPTALRRA